MDLLERDELAGLAITAFENLRKVRLVIWQMSSEPYRRIRALAQLLELLEGAGVAPVVHGGWEGRCVATAEVAYADGRVGAVCDRKSARVRRAELAGRRAIRVLRIPEDSARRDEFVGDAQLRRGRVSGGGSGGGSLWLGRRGSGKRCSVPGLFNVYVDLRVPVNSCDDRAC